MSHPLNAHFLSFRLYVCVRVTLALRVPWISEASPDSSTQGPEEVEGSRSRADWLVDLKWPLRNPQLYNYEVDLRTSISTQENYITHTPLFFFYPDSHSPPLLAPNRHLRHLWGPEGNALTKILSTGGKQLPHRDLSCVPASASDRPGEVNRGSVTVSQSQRQHLVRLHHS